MGRLPMRCAFMRSLSSGRSLPTRSGGRAYRQIATTRHPFAQTHPCKCKARPLLPSQLLGHTPLDITPPHGPWLPTGCPILPPTGACLSEQMADVTKTLWITSIRPETIGGQPFVPTAICYHGGVAIGHDAIDETDASVGFKLALGDIQPGQSPETRTMFQCSDGVRRSAFTLAQDFLNGILASAANLPPYDSSSIISTRVVVAEPLKFQVKNRKPEWLNNYRGNIRRILGRFQTVEFLPEPFAVYQYYKYGLRLPNLADRTKRFALILDMGGGTFDVCVIESTSEGDVSRTGSHSKPLSANSTPFAGFYLDCQIALYLMKKNVPDSKKHVVDRYYELYERTLLGELDKDNLRQEAQAFIANIERLRPMCEKKKIELSNAITDWQLGVEQYSRVEIDVPIDPLTNSEWAPTDLFGHQMFSVFEAIWKTKLENVVKNVLKGANDRLKGNKIDVSLISGGSANIGWLASLLKRDFADELEDAEPVNIEGSYQDVVANGLAIECARRHFSPSNESPEFVAVTYNPVRLLLASDGSDFAKLQFRSIDDKINMQRTQPGDLIPSAYVFRHFFGQALRWQAKLPSPPRQYLDYIFCRPSDPGKEDPDALDHAYNVEERRLHTSESRFDAKTTIEVIVHEDGTVEPKFIYKLENKRGGVSENSKKGRPFYIDMTTDASNTSMAHYVGLDFGTSNSSICCLSDDKIELVRKRSSSSSWRSMSEALTDIPFPAAAAIRRYLAQHDAAGIFNVALEAYEACLVVLAYGMAADTLYQNQTWRGLAGFQHRALGPLKALLRSSMGGRARGICIRDVAHVERIELLDDAVRHFTEGKHHQANQHSPKWVEYVEEISYAIVKALQGTLFGYCATSDKIPYEENRFEGTFKVAHDQPPFVRHYRYTSKQAIDPTVALVVEPAIRKARSLTPFFVWDQKTQSGVPVCYVLDQFESFQYKPCHIADRVPADKINPRLPRVVDRLRNEGRFVVGEIDLELQGLREGKDH